jgi:hypothetical protein
VSISGEWLLDLMHGLVDDAAVFPPGDASVPDAVAGHREHRRAWYADMVGPLLIRASQTAELAAATDPGEDLRVGLVADTQLAGLVQAVGLLADRDDRVAVQQVEIALPAGSDPGAGAKDLLEALPVSVTTYVEVPRTGFEPALDVLAADGAERAKYRTGGTTAAAFPSEAELAAFLHAAVVRAVPVKLTAGLHWALRNTTGDGREQHGFLNALAATAAARDGAGVAELAQLLAERRPGPLLAVLGAARVAEVRASLVSFGCCGAADPALDLVAAGLLAARP